MGMAQSTAAAQMVVQGAPKITDQQVEVRFSVSNQQGFSPSDLLPENIKLSEAVSNLKITGKAELPLTLALIVNLSNGSDIDLIKDTLHAYFNG